MRQNNKNIILEILLVATLVIALASIANAAELICLEKGQQIKFSECNPAIKDRTCSSNFGCQFCVTQIGSGAYCPASINQCNSQGLTCSTSTNTNPDTTPPELTILNPREGEIYNSRSVILNLDMNENTDVTFMNTILGDNKWKRVCSSCFSYNKKQNFKEGINQLLFQVTDQAEHISSYNVTFYVDSKKPKITRAEPLKGFASGIFNVQFSEENPKSLVLHYGNFFGGMKEKTLDIEDDCVLSDNKYACETNVDLSSYNGQTIEYWFYLSDIADSYHESKRVLLGVDTAFPLINSINYNQNGKKTDLIISITEQNLERVSYRDNSDFRSQFKKLCSRLDNEICAKSISLKPGEHDIDIQVSDKAGNSVSQNIIISV
ncbi:MAG: hypothetical protein AABX73_01280 [Nanoarchaeota archaeon]